MLTQFEKKYLYILPLCGFSIFGGGGGEGGDTKKRVCPFDL